MQTNMNPLYLMLYYQLKAKRNTIRKLQRMHGRLVLSILHRLVGIL